MTPRLQRLMAPRRHGAIAIIVLGFIFFLSVMVILFLELITNRIRYEGYSFQRDSLRDEAYMVLELSLAALHEIQTIDEGLFSPNQGWTNPVAYTEIELPDGLQATVTIEDLSGKFALRQLAEDEDTFRFLLEELGVEFSDADILIASLADWTDEDDDALLNGAEADWYEREDSTRRRPSNQPLRKLEDLRYIRGFDEQFFDPDTGEANERYHLFASAVTARGNHASPNLNTAPALVLTVLEEREGLQPENLSDFLTGNDRTPGTGDERFLRSAEEAQSEGVSLRVGDGAEFGFQAQTLQVSVEVRNAASSFFLTLITGEENEEDEDGAQDDGASPDEGQSGRSAPPNVRGTIPGGNSGGSARSSSGQRGGSTDEEGDGFQDYPFNIISLVENVRVD
ncbi:MAG: general secretion pathway protein GspK [Opitutales bacterium]